MARRKKKLRLKNKAKRIAGVSSSNKHDKDTPNSIEPNNQYSTSDDKKSFWRCVLVTFIFSIASIIVTYLITASKSDIVSLDQKVTSISNNHQKNMQEFQITNLRNLREYFYSGYQIFYFDKNMSMTTYDDIYMNRFSAIFSNPRLAKEGAELHVDVDSLNSPKGGIMMNYATLIFNLKMTDKILETESAVTFGGYNVGALIQRFDDGSFISAFGYVKK